MIYLYVCYWPGLEDCSSRRGIYCISIFVERLWVFVSIVSMIGKNTSSVVAQIAKGVFFSRGNPFNKEELDLLLFSLFLFFLKKEVIP